MDEVLRFRVVPGEYAVCTLADQGRPLARQPGFWCELHWAGHTTVYCAAELAPPGCTAELGWALLELDGAFEFTVVGVMARWTAPLARAGIPVMALSSFTTDYLLVRQTQLAPALQALAQAGCLLME